MRRQGSANGCCDTHRSLTKTVVKKKLDRNANNKNISHDDVAWPTEETAGSLDMVQTLSLIHI